MAKILICILLATLGNLAFAGGATMNRCDISGVELDVDLDPVISAALVISMTAQLELEISTPELRDPVTRQSVRCYGAFKNNDWNRFVCIVGQQAAVVNLDRTTQTCKIIPASEL